MALSFAQRIRTFPQRAWRRLAGDYFTPKQRLLRVKSPALRDRFDEGPNGDTIYSSSFNPAWVTELGVEPKVVLDVGGFDGGDAYRFHRLYPDALVISVEADPARAVLVRKALAGTPIKIVECAAAEADGIVAFYPTAEAAGPSAAGSLFRLTDKATEQLTHIQQSVEPIRVPGRRLEGVLAECGASTVSLLHMDIQGGEYGALLGLGRVRPDIIYLEVEAPYVGVKGKRAVHRLLARMGYVLAADVFSDRLYVHRTKLGARA